MFESLAAPRTPPHYRMSWTKLADALRAVTKEEKRWSTKKAAAPT